MNRLITRLRHFNPMLALFILGGTISFIAGTVLWIDANDNTTKILDERLASDQRDYIVQNTVPSQISIPAIDIKLDVVPGNVIDGIWEVSETKANYLIGSGVVGKPGNLVIYSHKRRGMFSRLPEVKLGDEIKIASRDMTGVYVVENMFETTPDDLSVLEPTSGHELTLYTCNRWDDSHRYIIKARLVRKFPNGLGGVIAENI